MSQRTIHWFRKGLRLHDNPALLNAAETSEQLWPVFILDPWFVKNYRVGANRWRFLMETLQDLDSSFRNLNGRLYVVRGNPIDVFPKLFQDWNVTQLTYEVDTEPYALKRDVEIDTLCGKHNVTVVKSVSHTLYDSDKVIAKNGGVPPLTYQRCQTTLSKLGCPSKPVPKLSLDLLKTCTIPVAESHSEKYDVPSLSELNMDEKELGPLLFPGGETEGLKRLEKNLRRTNWICNFEKPKTEPNSIQPSTTVLSPYLKFGCVSVRTLYWKLQEIYSSSKKFSQPPVSLHGQLLWREFFYIAGYGTPNFNMMEGNKVCRQIPWDTNPRYLEAWRSAKTGYPFIDAIMIQLKTEGWIHHLARHAVACFLTRGDLWISWEEGQKVFEEFLLDADWFLNAGNWMWLSASAFFHQYYRVYSPVAFGMKTDKEGEFIKKYIPKLKKFPAKYIYEPWTAPISVQKAAGCIIGQDYPKPIVDHSKVKDINLKRMKAAYDAGKQASNGEPSISEKKRKSKSPSKSPSPRKKMKDI